MDEQALVFLFNREIVDASRGRTFFIAKWRIISNNRFFREQTLIFLFNGQIVDASRGRTFHCKMVNNIESPFFREQALIWLFNREIVDASRGRTFFIAKWRIISNNRFFVSRP